ncbi:protein FAR-RED IMPAIRED RESPONSE 1-like [Corylus avellana]|uniref:protein FAR-RED IMPAIRED RESPONSE 1-like n=1 Tax=Corylus avellana TaxID=13451 RepID=UPI00286D0326|nr:protein FAR-RED IMPAIRED RESPONSE 1-like [Corylus avellana]
MEESQHEAAAPLPTMAFSPIDSENECEDENLRTHFPVGDDLPPQIVIENGENETVSDEDDNNGKGKGKFEWKLVSEDENVEQNQRGMTFSSMEDLRSYYRRFGRKKGFGVVIKKVTRDKITGESTRVTLACGRQGKPQPKTSQPNPTVKTDCKAKLNAKFVEGQWYVTSVVIDHNHDLSPKTGRYFKCNRNLNSNVRRKIIINDMSGIKLSQSYNALAVEAGGYENLPFIEKDCRNFINKERRIRLGQGGAKALLDYLNRMQAADSGFYFRVDVDDDSRLKNVFWVDARSRALYESFGDVVTFDTTYLTNKYGMPFAPFVGVNHHGQSILFGAALISSEDTENFVWLFENWLNCMNGQAPIAIITDQDRAMKNAIARVFPGTRHRYCLWHILKKIPDKFKSYSNYVAIKSAIHKCVYESQTCGDFEVGRKSLLDSYDLNDHDWLHQLYNDRTFWVPAYLKGVFWAGMRTTQRSESMNAFFDGYLHPSTTLKQFVDQYDLALRKKVENETHADFKSFTTKVKVQNAVVEDAYVKLVTYVVYFNGAEDEFEVKCTCDSFESRGIVCRHVFSVLCAHNITSLPPKYYLDRWRKDVKRRYTLIKSSFDALSANPEVERYDTLCKRMLTLAEVAARNVDDYTKVNKHIDMLMKELRGSSPPSLALPDVSLACNEFIDDVELAVDGNEVHSPNVAKKRGRLPHKRKMSAVEKSTVKNSNPNQRKRKKKTSHGDDVPHSDVFETQESATTEDMWPLALLER